MTSITYTFQPLVMHKHEVQSIARPKGRSGHRIVCDETNLYSYGGFNPSVADDLLMQDDPVWNRSKPLFEELWKFNFVTEQWHRIPTCGVGMPSEVASSAVVRVGHVLVIYGGTGVPFGENCSNKVYTCDLKTGRMMRLGSKGAPPEAQYGQAILVHDRYLYAVGGTTGWEYTCDIHRYNMIEREWESVYICSGRDPAEPRGRYRHELAFDGNIIYVLAGGTATEAFDFKKISAFNLTTKKWMVFETEKDPKMNAFPGSRRCHGSVQYTDETTGNISVVISGGHSGGVEFRDIWRLDLKTLQWTCLFGCFFPSPVYFHSVALTPQGKMYTFGGIIKSAGVITRTDAVMSAWLVIPKLQEICWEALSHYVRNLGRKSKAELIAMGVPLKFIQRLEIND